MRSRKLLAMALCGVMAASVAAPAFADSSVAEAAADRGGQTIGIAHADCEDDVNYLISLLRQHRSELDIMTVMYEPVTGSHVGPGTLALFFFGDQKFREQNESLLSSLSQKVDEGKETLLALAQKRGQKD